MNRHERGFGENLAILRYGHNEFEIVRPGRFVVCAISGRRIAIEDLRYWNVDRQEAYAGPQEAQAAWRKLRGLE